MVAALGASLDRQVEDSARVELVRDIETRVLGKPAGIQDYYSARSSEASTPWSSCPAASRRAAATWTRRPGCAT
jgi:hypothetical protein